MKVLQHFEKFRVLWHGVYITHNCPGYGYECPTELTAVPCTGNTRVEAHPLGGEFDLKWRI